MSPAQAELAAHSSRWDEAQTHAIVLRPQRRTRRAAVRQHPGLPTDLSRPLRSCPTDWIDCRQPASEAYLQDLIQESLPGTGVRDAPQRSASQRTIAPGCRAKVRVVRASTASPTHRWPASQATTITRRAASGCGAESQHGPAGFFKGNVVVTGDLGAKPARTALKN